MRIGLILLSLMLLGSSPRLQAQVTPPLPDDVEQSEALRETLKRMQIQREEVAFSKLLEKGKQLEERVAELILALASDPPSSDQMVQPRPPVEVERHLREIEKLARQVRSEAGGTKIEEKVELPSTLAKTIDQLTEASSQLNAALAKSSRRVISWSVIKRATEVIDLTRHLRTTLY